MRFTIPGLIKPKARPRAMPCWCGASPRMRTDPAYREWKDREAAAIGWGNKPNEPLEGYLNAEVIVTKEGTSVMLWQATDGDHVGRKSLPGDIDNYAGAVMDALQDAGVYGNDRQIVELKVTLK